MKKLNVLLVTEYFPPKIMGGGEININQVANALVKNSVNVYVLTSHFNGLKRYEDVNGIKIFRRLKTSDNINGVFGNFKRSVFFPNSVANEVQKLKKKIDFDVVHLIGTSIIAAKNIKKNRRKPFATIESYPTLCPKGDRIYKGKKECKLRCSFLKFLGCQLKSEEIGKIKNKFYLKYNPLFLIYLFAYYKRLNKSLKYCNLIAISEYIQKLLAREKLQSRVIPNAIDTSKFYYKEGKGPKPKIVYLGSLTKYKGPQILLKALRNLGCRCDLYGEGVMKDELNNMISKYDLNAEIHNNVPYEEVPSIYANSDIVVFPSVWPEPFGRIAIEAMAAGKPVIGSAVGGIKETLDDIGILVNPGKIEELKIALEKLKKKPKVKKSIREKTFKLIKKYSERTVIKKLINYYGDVLNAN